MHRQNLAIWKDRVKEKSNENQPFSYTWCAFQGIIKHSEIRGILNTLNPHKLLLFFMFEEETSTIGLPWLHTIINHLSLYSSHNIGHHSSTGTFWPQSTGWYFLELMCLCGLLSVFTNRWYKWTFCVRYCKATPLSIQIKLCPHNYRTWQLLSQSFEERAFTQILRFLLFGWRNSINKIFQTKNDNPGFQILYSLSHTHINTHTHTRTQD